MADLSFISSVVAILLVRAGQRAGWGDGADLIALVRDRFRYDADAQSALASVASDIAGADVLTTLAAAVLRHAEIDRRFSADIRHAVVAAYADPMIAPGLPDPTPDV